MFNFLNQGILGFIFWLNGFFNDFGITIIFFTLILKIALAPIDFLSFLEEIKLQRIRPKINEVLKKYKNDFKKQAEELTKIYREENYNPLFTIFIQFFSIPILFSVFFVLNKLIKSNLNLFFLQTIDLSQKNIFLVLVVVVLQFLTIFNLPKDQRKIAFFFFGFIVLVLIQFPALFNLYWLTNLILTLLERYIFRLYQIKFSIQSIPKNDS